MKLICDQCKKEFFRTSGLYKQSKERGYKRHFCSLKCSGLASRNRVKLQCTHCKTDIEKRQADVDRSNTGNFFCSRSCSAKYNNSKCPKRLKKNMECLTCGNEIVGNKKYCSKDCWPRIRTAEYMSRKDIVSKIRNRIKKKAVDLMGGKCKICGYDKCVQALHFHHLDPKEKDFNISESSSWKEAKKELRKCIMVCGNCHSEIHYGIIKI